MECLISLMELASKDNSIQINNLKVMVFSIILMEKFVILVVGKRIVFMVLEYFIVKINKKLIPKQIIKILMIFNGSTMRDSSIWMLSKALVLFTWQMEIDLVGVSRTTLLKVLEHFTYRKKIKISMEYGSIIYLDTDLYQIISNNHKDQSFFILISFLGFRYDPHHLINCHHLTSQKLVSSL